MKSMNFTTEKDWIKSSLFTGRISWILDSSSIQEKKNPQAYSWFFQYTLFDKQNEIVQQDYSWEDTLFCNLKDYVSTAIYAHSLPQGGGKKNLKKCCKWSPNQHEKYLLN